MAESVYLLGYQCEFIDTVHDNFYCKICTLVARRLTYTSCCGESYCHACITDIQQQDKPCPECGHQNFSTMKPLKHQKQMNCLKVKCSMRGRGCDWLGTLGQLDAHLDPDQDNCQHVDIKCSLNCLQTIPKNKLEQHVSMECVKRDSVCQYCHFKATYEVMVDTHWPVCNYFPLQCPNFCGVTCERDVMEDHMRMCRLEEVECEFSGVGCDKRFRREDQEEHTRQNNQMHLAMTAATSVMMSQKLQQKLLEQEEKLQEQEEKQQEQEEKLQEQEEKLQEQEEKLQEQEMRFQVLEQMFHKLLQEQEKTFVRLEEKSVQTEGAIDNETNFIVLKRRFAMENFSLEKVKDKADDWMSPAMYTHMCGYKFCIGIYANGHGLIRGKAMSVFLYAMQGEHDHLLKWPALVSFTIELLHQHGGLNIIHTLTKVQWQKPTTPYTYINGFTNIHCGLRRVFLEHSKLTDFLDNDTLHFHLSNITVY